MTVNFSVTIKLYSFTLGLGSDLLHLLVYIRVTAGIHTLQEILTNIYMQSSRQQEYTQDLGARPELFFTPSDTANARGISDFK